MNNALETVYYAHDDANKRFKIEVVYDEEAHDPTTEDYFECPLNVALAAYDSTGAVGWHDFELREAIERMDGEMSYRDHQPHQGLSSNWTKRDSEHLENLVYAVNRYAAFCGLEKRLYMFHHTGHSQRDWATVLVEATDENVARGHFDIWSDWANGYVYGVVSTVEEFDEEIEVWIETNDTDGLWGIDGIGWDAEEAAHYYAREYAPTELVRTEIEGD